MRIEGADEHVKVRRVVGTFRLGGELALPPLLGPTYLEALVAMYEQDLANVQRNFDLVSQLDVGLLKEFQISQDLTRSTAALKKSEGELRKSGVIN